MAMRTLACMHYGALTSACATPGMICRSGPHTNPSGQDYLAACLFNVLTLFGSASGFWLMSLRKGKNESIVLALSTLAAVFLFVLSCIQVRV